MAVFQDQDQQAKKAPVRTILIIVAVMLICCCCAAAIGIAIWKRNDIKDALSWLPFYINYLHPGL
jgi:hypothetical protein